MLVHHTRKQKDMDNFNQISGTTGLMGSVDSTYLLSRDSRLDNKAKLSVTGRDIVSDDYVLTFDQDNCTWKMEATVAEIERKRFKDAYHASPIVSTIKELVAKPPHEWSGTVTELVELAQKKVLHGEEITERRAVKEINDFGCLLENEDGIYHKYVRKSEGRIHTFYLKDEKN